MSIAGFLFGLRKAGIELRLENDRLICDAPKGVMTPQILSDLKLKKPEILTFLKKAANSAWSPLIAIQPNGSRPPFFCFHGVGGNVLNYRVFVPFLGGDQPLYGLQSRGIDGKMVPFKDIVPMAEYYLSEIKKVQPEGPYYLGGGSMGGVVAFEVAQQLQRAKQRIGSLIMFDAIGPNYKSSPNYGPSREQKFFKQLLKAKNFTIAFQLIKEKITLRREYMNKMRVCKKMQAQKTTMPHELRFWYVEQMNRNAMEKYAFTPFDGEITLFRGILEKEGVYSDPERGWGGIPKKGLKIFEVPGHHETLVEESLLGELLAKRLYEAQIIE